jgi:hypothetical protein
LPSISHVGEAGGGSQVSSQVSSWVASLGIWGNQIRRTTGSIGDATRGNPEQTSAASRHRDQGTVLHPHFGCCLAARTGSIEGVCCRQRHGPCSRRRLSHARGRQVWLVAPAEKIGVVSRWRSVCMVEIVTVCQISGSQTGTTQPTVGLSQRRPEGCRHQRAGGRGGTIVMQVSVWPEDFLALSSFRGVVSFSNGVRELRKLDRRANSLALGNTQTSSFGEYNAEKIG